MFIRSANPEQILFMRLTGCAFGLVLAAVGFGAVSGAFQGTGGEIWIFVDDSGNFSLKYFNDGFYLIWFWIILAGSIGMIVLAFNAYMEYRKPTDQL